MLESRRDTTRRLRRTRAAVSIALVVAVGLATFALIQQRIAVANQNTAQSRQLAAQAENTLGSDPELSTLLSLQALHVSYTTQAEAALRDALPNLQLLTTINEGSRLNDATLSPDGTRLLAAGSDDTARIWNATTGKQLTVLHEPGGAILDSAAFNPSGTRVLTASDDGTARIWDSATGRNLPTVREPGGGRIVRAIFSPTGSFILTASSDGNAWTRDPETGGLETILSPSDAANLTSAALSPDGRLAVLSSLDGAASVWDVSGHGGEPAKGPSWRCARCRVQP